MPKEFDLKKYSKLFVSESREYLRTLNDSMVELEGNPENRDLIDQMFRACHTIKGMAGMMNLGPVTETAHALEDVFAAIRERKLRPSGNAAEGVFRGLDALESMVAELEKTGRVTEIPGIVEALRAITSGAQEIVTTGAEPEMPAPVEGTLTINVRFAKKCALPSARALVILKDFEKNIRIIRTDPTEEDIEHERVFEELSIIIEPGEKLEETLQKVAAMGDVDEVISGPTGTPKSTWRKIGRATEAKMSVDAPTVQTVRVGMDKLDDLLDDVGELVISRSRLLQKATAGDDHELMEISSLIDKLTSEIQSKVLGIRMIPLELMMSRFPRMVRDISKAQGKEVELIVEGGNIELDRTVVDRITDPLMHIIRNCIDHGIETPEQRAKASKREKGIIRIVASKQQDHVLIEISDDGAGIDFRDVRRVAVSRGILTKELADNALGRDLLDLLFRPGFSTKSEVTEISGRGVGLDIVKRGVEELGGSIMINTSKGAGTTFSLWLPFTLAIIDAMLVQVAGQMYAAPMSVVVESHKYERDEIKMIRNREVVQLRGEVIPLIRLRDFFGIAPRPNEGAIEVLIVQSRERRAALAVDELMGHQQIVVKSLDQRLRRVRGISGGTILGSGGIALILDVDSILGG